MINSSVFQKFTLLIYSVAALMPIKNTCRGTINRWS